MNFREYKKLDRRKYEFVYKTNKDKSLANDDIYIFGDQEPVVRTGFRSGWSFSIEKIDKVVDGYKSGEMIYVLIFDGIGYKRVDLNAAFSREEIKLHEKFLKPVVDLKKVAGR